MSVFAERNPCIFRPIPCIVLLRQLLGSRVIWQQTVIWLDSSLQHIWARGIHLISLQGSRYKLFAGPSVLVESFIMVFLTWSVIVASALIFARGASSLPFNESIFEGLDSPAHGILARATPAAPHFVAYTDAYDGNTGPPPVAQVKVIIHTHSCYLVLNKSFPGLQCHVSFISIQYICQDPSMTHGSNLAFLLLAGPWDKVLSMNSRETL
jgi:hypothetical protein